MHFRQKMAAAACGLLAWSSVLAADLEEVTVDRVDGRYVLESQAMFDTTVEELYSVLVDYDQFEKFTSAFTESRNEAPDEKGRPQFYNAMEGCVLFFCVTFERYGHLELRPKSRIEAIVDPERSDFKYSVESWDITRVDGRTEMIYRFEMEPDFWVPPVIGPYYIRRALRDGAVRAVNRIEAVALGLEPEPVGGE